MPVEHLRKVVRWARGRNVIVVADECYAELEWTSPAPSLLAGEVCDHDHTGLLVLHSLSKRSNMAGYRFGFLAGDAELVAGVLGVRKHAGMMVPGPVQAAAAAAYADDGHVQEQRERYRRRRDVLLTLPRRVSGSITRRLGSISGLLKAGRPARPSAAWPTSVCSAHPATSTVHVEPNTCGSP